MKESNKQRLWWLGALVLGSMLGLLHCKGVDAGHRREECRGEGHPEPSSLR